MTVDNEVFGCIMGCSLEDLVVIREKTEIHGGGILVFQFFIQPLRYIVIIFYTTLLTASL